MPILALMLYLAAVLSLASISTAYAARFPLEITNLGQGLSAQNRVTRAFPGLLYNIRAAVVGGSYPYTFTLSDAPDGMTIDSRTGEITWPNPQRNATPRITVVDSEGTEVSAAWTIVVTSAGFRFVDAAAGKHAAGNACTTGCGDGSATNPWRSVSDVFHNGQAGEFVYFRSGTYGLADLPLTRPGSPWERIEIGAGRRPVVWIAAPGHKPVLDFGYRPGADSSPLIRLIGDNVYVDGLETTHSRYIAFQYESRGGIGPTFRRMRMHTHGPGLRGANAALILTVVADTPSSSMVVQDSQFFGIVYGDGNCALKIYSQAKLLVEDNTFDVTDAGSEAVVALKQDVRQFTVRGNRFTVGGKAIGGNMSSAGNRETRTTTGEILFNNVRARNYALELNQNSQAMQIHVYRNTLVGRVNIRNTDSGDGPFYFSRNVIVNDDTGTPRGSRVTHENVSDDTRIVHVDNLAGAPGRNIVDAQGNLTRAYQKYFGTHGHQLGRAVPSR